MPFLHLSCNSWKRYDCFKELQIGVIFQITFSETESEAWTALVYVVASNFMDKFLTALFLEIDNSPLCGN